LHDERKLAKENFIIRRLMFSNKEREILSTKKVFGKKSSVSNFLVLNRSYKYYRF